MNHNNFETLSTKVNSLTNEGFTESFSANNNCIQGARSKKEYQPEDLRIIKSFRFDGMTNPADETEVFALEANDGSKGTLVMSHSTEHNHEVDLIKKIPRAE